MQHGDKVVGKSEDTTWGTDIDLYEIFRGIIKNKIMRI
jgi:hypothetical protein